jgi:hypothetical protein
MLATPLDAFLSEPSQVSDEELAAYRFAKEAHQGQSRNKYLMFPAGDERVEAVRHDVKSRLKLQRVSDKKLVQVLTDTLETVVMHDDEGGFTVIKPYPYDMHLRLVHQLLRESGVTDKKILAASFLHDVMEDCHDERGQKYTKDTLAAAYGKAIGADTSEETRAFVHDVVDLVERVTNDDKKLALNKRHYQVEKMRVSEDDAKLLKSADQTASLIEDVMARSSAGDAKIHAFVMKAREVVAACDTDAPQSKILHAIADEAYSWYASLPSTRLALEREQRVAGSLALHERTEKHVRKQFDLKGFIDRAKESAHAMGAHGNVVLDAMQHEDSLAVQGLEKHRVGEHVAGLPVSLGVVTTKRHADAQDDVQQAGHVSGVRFEYASDAKEQMIPLIYQVVEAVERSGGREYDGLHRVETRTHLEHGRQSVLDIAIEPPMTAKDFKEAFAWGYNARTAFPNTVEFLEQYKQQDVYAHNPATTSGITLDEGMAYENSPSRVIAARGAQYKDPIEVVHVQTPAPKWGI